MIRFAIVGCGHIARKHAEAILTEQGAMLDAVCDTNCINLSDFSSKYGARPFSDFDELLRDPHIDVVSICTPSGLHALLAVKAAVAGKHVIVEKPIALTLEDADSMIEACKANGVKLAVVHPNRFRPAVVEMRKALKEGKFGKLSHMNATLRWNRNQAYYDQAAWRGTKAFDGGVLMNQAIHNMDLLLWLGGKVESVQAYTATRLRTMETEDVAVGIVRFTGGALGVIEAAATVYPNNLEESISVFGEKGTAVIGGQTANWIKHWRFEGLDEAECRQTIAKVASDPFGTAGHQLIVRDMIEAIEQEREPIVTGKDGRDALELVLAMYRNADGRELFDERMNVRV